MPMSTNVPAKFNRQRKMNDGSTTPITVDRYEVKLNGTVICKLRVCDFFTGTLDPAEYLEFLGLGVPSLRLTDTDRNVLVEQIEDVNNVERKFFINGMDNQRLTVQDVEEHLIPIFAEGNFTLRKIENPDQVEKKGLDKLRKEAEAMKLAKKLDEKEEKPITDDDIPF